MHCIRAILQVPESAWEAYGKPHTREIRECAEIDFVPGEKSEHKDTKPLRSFAESLALKLLSLVVFINGAMS